MDTIQAGVGHGAIWLVRRTRFGGQAAERQPPVTVHINAGPADFHDYLTVDEARQIAAMLIAVVDEIDKERVDA